MKLKIGLLFFACVLTAGAVVFAQMMGSGRLSPAAYDRYQNSLQEDTTSVQEDAQKLEQQSGKLINLLKLSSPPANGSLKSQVEAFNNSLTGFNVSAWAVNLNVNALQFDTDISTKKDKEEALRKDVLAAFKLSADDLDSLRKRGFSYSEILIAHNLVNVLSRTPGAGLGASTDKVYLLRESGKGWGEVFRSLGAKKQHLPALGELLTVPKNVKPQPVQPPEGENGDGKK